MKKKFSKTWIGILFVLSNLPLISYAQWTQVGDSIRSQELMQIPMSSALNQDGSVLATSEQIIAERGLVFAVIKVFRFENGSWAQINDSISFNSGAPRKLKLSGDGNTLAIMDPGEMIAIGGIVFSDVGYIEIYQNVDNQWVRTIRLTGDRGGAEFGTSLDFNYDGTRFIVGSPGTAMDRALVYELRDGTWTQIGQPIMDVNVTQVGHAVTMDGSGNRIALGSPLDNNAVGLVAGMVMVMDYNEQKNRWENTTSPILGREELEFFGHDVELDETGTKMAVISQNTFSEEKQVVGSFRLLALEDGEWVQKGEDVFTDADMNFLTILEMSNSANRVLIANGLFNDNQGSLSLYEFDTVNENWDQVNETIIGGSMRNFDGIARRVSLSGNGEYISSNGKVPNPDDVLDAIRLVRVFRSEPRILSANTFESNSILSVFPNPSNDTFMLNLPELNTQEAMVQVYNSAGGLVMEKLIPAIRNQEFTHNFISGLYFIKITAESKQFVAKIMIEK